MKVEKILKRPIITEKSMRMVEEENKYTFEIANNTTAGAVKRSIESVFSVRVVSVSVLKNRGKLKRSMVGKRNEYRSKDTKKAIIKLSEKDSIKLFEKNQK